MRYPNMPLKVRFWCTMPLAAVATAAAAKADTLYLTGDGMSSIVAVDSVTHSSHTYATVGPSLEGIVNDSSGDLFVYSYWDHTIFKVSPGGTSVTPFATGFSDAFGLAIDRSGLPHEWWARRRAA